MSSNNKNKTTKEQGKLSRGVIKKVAKALGISIPAAWARIYQLHEPEALTLAAKYETEAKNNVKEAIKKFKRATSMQII